jgi:hypothetical protein
LGLDWDWDWDWDWDLIGLDREWNGLDKVREYWNWNCSVMGVRKVDGFLPNLSAAFTSYYGLEKTGYESTHSRSQ